MPDLKLTPGALWGEPIRVMALPKSAAIVTAVDIFRYNFGRVHSFSTLLSNLLVTTIIIERARCEEWDKIRSSGIIMPSSVIVDRINKNINDKLNQHKHEEVQNGANVLASHANLIDEAYNNIQFLCDNNSVTLNATKSWFYAQLTGVWTACEILFADLWAAAVNTKPRELHGFDNEAKLGNAINIARLSQYNFDISGNLGTLLREKKNFDSLEAIIVNYENSFRTDGNGVNAALNSDCFKILSNIRHIIVHNAARVDARYLKNLPSRITDAPRGAIGEEIPIDAEIVYSILHPVAENIVNLIREVDEWILMH